ncbi:N-acetylmuramoyl-L-alanine amidase, partial [Micromonospora fluostatini]
LTVHEVDGWRSRGSDSFTPRGLICHATAGSRSSTDAGEIRVLLTGSTSAPPPIAQLYVGRNGHWHVIASGRCNHALAGWAGPLKGLGNTNLIGVEAANDNRGEPWPAAQLNAYQRGVAAICRRMGWKADRVAGHKEHQPYPPPAGKTSTKSDPTFDMRQFRARVTALLAGEDDDMPTAAEVGKYLMEQYKTPDGRTLAGSLDALLKPDGANALGKQVTRSDTVPAARPPYQNSDYGDPAKATQGNKEWTVGYALQAGVEAARAALAEVRAVRAGQAAVLAAVEGLDTKAVLARIDQAAAEAASRDAALVELVRAGQTGQLAADEVVRRIGELLTASSGTARE